MSRRLAAILASLAGAACSFGIVDVPEAGLEVTRLGLLIETTDSASDRVVVSAGLQPGDLADGRERAIVDPILGVFDASLTPESTVDPTGVLLLWTDTVQAADPDVPIPIRPPQVEGLDSPTAPSMVLRRAAGHSGDPAGWVAGSDLSLFLRPALSADDAPTQAQWRLDVAVLDSLGALTLSLASLVTGQIPDTVDLPQSWLDAPPGGSLEATIQLHRTYLSSGSGGAYEVAGTLRQRFRWSIQVR